MTTAQASVAPVVADGQLETVTLKNLVAAELVEQNECVLQALQLLDDRATRVELPITRTREGVLQMIEEKKKELQALKSEKNTLADSADAEKLSALAAEFLKDDVPSDDVDEALKAFEKENGLKVVEKGSENYWTVQCESLKKKSEELNEMAKVKEDAKDADGDVEIST